MISLESTKSLKIYRHAYIRVNKIAYLLLILITPNIDK